MLNLSYSSVYREQRRHSTIDVPVGSGTAEGHTSGGGGSMTLDDGMGASVPCAGEGWVFTRRRLRRRRIRFTDRSICTASTLAPSEA